MNSMKISINALTQEKYKIPIDLNDSRKIIEFVNKNKDKKLVVVQGLGFVGAVMSLVCANATNENYAVIGIDLASEESYWKIRSLNEGLFPLIANDPKIEELFENTKIRGNFLATHDPFAFSFADIIIVDVNLDVQKKSYSSHALQNFDVDLESFKKAIETIGENCKDDVTVLVETTVPPGTCENIVKPILDEKLLKRCLSTSNYILGHSYERVMPGPDYVDSISSYPRVYSGVDKKSADKIEFFLRTIINTEVCQLSRLESTNATEMAKVLENSYRAMNIAFAVEWSRFAEEANVNLYEIINAIRVRKTHNNLMYPGIGVGGYCLTKDPLLASWARKNFFSSKNDLEVSINSVSINDQMPVYAFNRLKEVFGSLNGKKVVFLGVSYRGDVGDTRYSPVEAMFNKVSDDNASIKLHDPFVNFWQEKLCFVDDDLNNTLQDCPDMIIISTGHSEYKNDSTIQKLMSIQPTNIFDTVGLFSNKQLTLLQSMHKVSVLGRGDII
jgi:UDP-N-acetyl-D-glucosamine dehydrogenase